MQMVGTGFDDGAYLTACGSAELDPSVTGDIGVLLQVLDRGQRGGRCQ